MEGAAYAIAFCGAGIGLLIYLSPFVYASTSAQGYHSSGLALVFQENIQRFFAPFDHKEPFYVYLYHIPTLFLPWSILLVLALIGIIPRWKNLDDKTRWLLKAAALIFLIFTASGSRRSYYILPIIPFCGLLVAIFLVHIRDVKVDPLRKLGLDIQQVIFAVIILLEISSPLVVPLALKIIKPGFKLPAAFYAANVIIGLAAIICWILLYNRKRFIPTDFQTEPRLSGIDRGYSYRYRRVFLLAGEHA